MAVKSNGKINMSVSTNTLFTNNITLLVLAEYNKLKNVFYNRWAETVLNDRYIFAFSLLFIFIIVGFGLYPKSTALLTAYAINFKKMMPWKMITQKVMIMKIANNEAHKI